MHAAIRQPVHSIALLDPLRALAAWAVVAWHLAPYFHYRMPVFSSAAFAVDVFMNISGFLMFFHFVDRESREPWTSARTWARFYVRRWFRIVPLFALLAAICLLIPQVRKEIVLPPDLSGWGYFVERVSFVFGLLPSQTDNAVMPDWSLSLEMQFYLLFPFLALLARRVGFGLFFFLCCSVGAITALLVSYYKGVPPGPLGHYQQPSILPLKIHIFAVGMVAAGVFLQGRKVLLSWWYLPAFLAMGLSCRNNYSSLLFGVYVAGYVALLLPKAGGFFTRSIGRVNTWCEGHPWMKWLAEFSYSTYLIHQILFTLVFGGLYRFSGIQLTRPWEYLGVLLLALLVINAIGFLCFKFVEKPAIDLGRKIIARALPARPRGI